MYLLALAISAINISIVVFDYITYLLVAFHNFGVELKITPRSGTVLFWVVTQRVVIISYRRFGKNISVPSSGVMDTDSRPPEEETDRFFPKRR